MCTDPLNTRKERLSCTRFFLKIIAIDVLVEELEIELPNGKTLVQKVEYEWVPPRYLDVNALGAQLLNVQIFKENGYNLTMTQTSLRTRLFWREEVELEGGSLGEPMVTKEGGSAVGSISG
ncbi:uncharacterized protein M6B38_279700 [Iris pallida]|uniref:Uncharacterized protein n=1 Tax=Iris pallida TaxID=29817 RepID=A0AAX6HZ25_IRIPA|nr:uncharacterized protein M6B38_279700 [Iris pallida]